MIGRFVRIDKNVIRPHLERAREAVDAQMTPALKVGLGVCVVLFIVYFLSLVAGAVEQKKTAVEDLKREIALQRTRLEGINWADRAAQARSVQAAASQRLWTGATSGLAQASFEKWLRDTFESAGLAVTQLRLRTGPVSPTDQINQTLASDLELITAKVLMQFDERGFAQALQAIAAHEAIVVVRQLNARAGPTMRIEMDVDTYRFRGDAR